VALLNIPAFYSLKMNVLPHSFRNGKMGGFTDNPPSCFWFFVSKTTPTAAKAVALMRCFCCEIVPSCRIVYR